MSLFFCCHWLPTKLSEVPVLFDKNLADLSVNSTYCF